MNSVKPLAFIAMALFMNCNYTFPYKVTDTNQTRVTGEEAEKIILSLYQQSNLPPRDRILRITTLAVQIRGRYKPYGESIFYGANKWPILIDPLTNNLRPPEHKNWFPGIDYTFLELWYTKGCDKALLRDLESQELVRGPSFDSKKGALSKNEQEQIIGKVISLLNSIYPN